MFTRKPKVPAYVAHISAGHVFLVGDVRAVKNLIRSSALSNRLTRGLFGWKVHFTEGPGGHLENGDLQDVVAALASVGIAFGEDYKQGWSPADVAREFRKRGLVVVPIKTIAWSGPGRWHVFVQADA